MLESEPGQGLVLKSEQGLGARIRARARAVGARIRTWARAGAEI